MRRIAFLPALLLAAACTSPATTQDTPGTTAPGAGGAPATAALLPDGPGGVMLDAVRVLDGDSLEADLGGASVEIRLLGINTPEREECWAREAREAAAALVTVGPVEFEDLGEDRFGRRLGYVTAGGVFVNAALVSGGHALAITADHRYADDFASATDAAFRAGLGMWAPEACGPASGADVRIDAVDGNPRGPDDDPASGESATIRNHGSATVDLGGWVLRDESSAHRYEFPAGTSLGPGDRLRVSSICGVHEHCFGDWDTVWSNGGDTALLLDEHGNVVDRVPFSG